ncbi:MAG: hypothetical protein LUD39_04040 [Opitutae bacterium]|nr:hypothetical protein [Opitutae bacterium]
MLPFIFPRPDSYGQNVPAQPVPEQAAKATPAAAGDFVNTLILADIALYKRSDDIKKCAARILERAEKINDETLRQITISSLQQIIAEPENAEKIRREHLKKVGEYFAATAFAAHDAKRNEDALAAVQIALRCDPANARARLLFANLIEPTAALQTLHYGIKFLDLNSEIAPVYFNRYFDALSNLQQDKIAAKQALALLAEKSLPAPVHAAVASHAAMSLFWIGDYAGALKVLDGEKISDSQQGLILKSRCMFELGQRDAAIALLSGSVNKFPPEKRDVILSQLSHFMQNLGDISGALKIADRRVQENPTSPTPYLQRLYLFRKNGEKENFNSELEQIFTVFPSSQTALATLANFAAESGEPAIAKRCVRCAAEHQFGTGIFTAAYIEALVTANDPDTAIQSYIEISKNYPKTFEGIETPVNAILAAAYTRIATPEFTPDEETRKTLLNHAGLLLAQYLEDKTLTPENFISATNLFKRIGADETALKIAEAGLKSFPWHSQIRANAISMRIKLNIISGSATRAPLAKEIRALAIMRRPAPEIWQEIAAWLATTNSLSAEDAAALKKIVAPLAKSDLHYANVKEF